MNLLFLDTETTGLEEQDRLIQIAFTLRENGKVPNDNGLVYPRAEYFKSSLPISFEAMSVHHITHKMIEDKPEFNQSPMKEFLRKYTDDSIFIAHNAKFDLRMMEKEGLKFKLSIDTQRVSMHLFHSESYRLQYLRYCLGLEVEAMAHDASGDVKVLEKLFDYLYSKIEQDLRTSQFEKIIDHMLTLSITPVCLRNFSFGKYKGKTFAEVANFDRSYFMWLYNSEMGKIESDRNEDLLFTLKQYLNYGA